ncbi:MAG TPA: MarR family transcriptional regulator [Egibacteraceae bacterium]|nr:MarR family transcriptional regulator [Egibacteraceae bacterium]
MHARQARADVVSRCPASLGQLVGRVEQRITRAVERVLASSGTNVEQWRVLDLLSDGEGHPMSEIARHAMVPPPTLTKIVDRLIDSALVYRRPDEVDRRRVLVMLSDHGREFHERMAPEVARAENEVTAELTTADRDQLVRLLSGLAG